MGKTGLDQKDPGQEVFAKLCLRRPGGFLTEGLFCSSCFVVLSALVA